jgi:hypothetical protein
VGTVTLLPRRRLFGIGAALLAAPAIVRVSSIMPVSVLREDGFLTFYDIDGNRIRCVATSGPGPYAVGDTLSVRGLPFTIEDGSLPWAPPTPDEEAGLFAWMRAQITPSPRQG